MLSLSTSATTSLQPTSSTSLTQLPIETCLLDIGSYLDGRDFFALVCCCRHLWENSRSDDYAMVIRDRYTISSEAPRRLVIDLPQYRTSYNEYVVLKGMFKGVWLETMIQYHHPAIGSLTVIEGWTGLHVHYRIKLFDLSGKEIIEIITQRNYVNASIMWRQNGFSHDLDWKEALSPCQQEDREHRVMLPALYSGSIGHLFRMTEHCIPGWSYQEADSSVDQTETPDSQSLDLDRLSYQCYSYIDPDSLSRMTCTSPWGNFRIAPEGTLQDKDPTKEKYLQSTVGPTIQPTIRSTVPLSPCTTREDTHDMVITQLRKRWALPEDCNLHQELRRIIALLTPKQYQIKIAEVLQPWYDRVPVIQELLSQAWGPMNNPQASLAANWRAIHGQEPLTRGHTWSYSLIGEDNHKVLQKI